MRSENQAAQGANTRVTYGGASWVQTLTSTSLGVQPAEATKYFISPPLFETPRIQVATEAQK